MVRTGTSEQIALIDLIDRLSGQYPVLRRVFHTPNGELRDEATAKKLKRMGVRRGIPDILLPYSSNGSVGLAIEMKSRNEEISPEQEDWMTYLSGQGWECHVCRTMEHAFSLIAAYCGIPASAVSGLDMKRRN